MGSDFARYQVNELSVSVPNGTTLSGGIMEG
jgi:hypothetical protein